MWAWMFVLSLHVSPEMNRRVTQDVLRRPMSAGIGSIPPVTLKRISGFTWWMDGVSKTTISNASLPSWTLRTTEAAISTALHSVFTHLKKNNAYTRMLFVDFSSVFNTISALKLIGKLHTPGSGTMHPLWQTHYCTSGHQADNTSSTSMIMQRTIYCSASAKTRIWLFILEKSAKDKPPFYISYL